MANETLIDSVSDTKKRTLKDIVDPYLPRKKHILPVIEALTGITAAGEKGRELNLLDLALASPVIGGSLKGAKGIYQAWAAAVRKAGFSNADSAILTASQALQSKTSVDFVKWLKEHSKKFFGSSIKVESLTTGAKGASQSRRRGRKLTERQKNLNAADEAMQNRQRERMGERVGSDYYTKYKPKK
jgi:hypothetical protein|tara:strand:+ start:687 stop:1244 length:558 start_codon:yes stop_codon:yes gene_type:complete